jgi:hypothetical protein
MTGTFQKNAFPLPSGPKFTFQSETSNEEGEDMRSSQAGSSTNVTEENNRKRPGINHKP